MYNIHLSPHSKKTWSKLVKHLSVGVASIASAVEVQPVTGSGPGSSRSFLSERQSARLSSGLKTGSDRMCPPSISFRPGAEL